MSEKKRPTDEELLAQFDTLGTSTPNVSAAAKSASAQPTISKTATATADPLAELENLAQERPKSRPHTPHVAVGGGADKKTASPKKSSESAARKSTESARSFRSGLAISEETAKAETAGATAGGGGGGWWGTISGLASAATKQAEALAKEIQRNEEAQRWAEQVRGNVGVLRSYGDELRSKALPTFNNLLHTLAPPISSHERLQIHIAHDLAGYPSLDPLIYQTFSRVMAQVEGGELLVVQRGQESTQRRPSETGYRGSAAAGWSDGPWWKDSSVKRDLSAVAGVVAASKLVRASAESHATDFYASRGGIEEAAKQASEVLSESNPTRKSDIFIAIQATTYQQDPEMFAGGRVGADKVEGVKEPEEKKEELIAFAVHLYDPVHGISFSAVSQSLPQPWVSWLDNLAAVPDAPANHMPDAIREIVESGGLDPREWVAEWVEETLGLAVGTVAQRYVAKRMGVGEGGFAKGKAKEGTVDAGAGEAARAL